MIIQQYFQEADMDERVTIMFDEKINKIISRQANDIKKRSKNKSFSAQVNEDLARYYNVKL